MERYLVTVIFMRFLVDLLLLIGAYRLMERQPRLWRCALGAAVSAGYAGWCLMPGFSFLGGMPWRLVFIGLSAMAAFGLEKTAIKPGLLFGVMDMVLGSAAAGLEKGSGWPMIALGIGAGALWLLGHRSAAAGGRYVPISITHGGKTVSLTALVDTGNTLRDPVTGRGVLVADADAARHLLGLTQQQLMRPIETMAAVSIRGLRLIPYCSVGQPAGLLLAIKVDELKMNGKPSDYIVAFAPQYLGQGRAFQALAGGAA